MPIGDPGGDVEWTDDELDEWLDPADRGADSGARAGVCTLTAVGGTPATESGVLCPIRTTPAGWHIMRIHYSVVPGYDYNAIARTLSEQGRQRELEINWHATSGRVVYPEFRYETHVATSPILWNGEHLYCGWDWGFVPAFVPTFLNGHGQWCILKPLAPFEDQNLGTYEFGEMVADYLLQEFAVPMGWTLKQLGEHMSHIGDPAGGQRAIRTPNTKREDMRTHFDIIRRGVEIPTGTNANGDPIYLKKPGWGWSILPGAVSNTERQQAVKTRLNHLISGLSAVVIDPSATVITEGLGGMYRYPERADGRYGLDPEKNYWSHAINSVEYISTRLFAVAPQVDDEDKPQRRKVRSQAAGRR